MKKDKPYDRTVYQSLTMILQFGINMVVPIAMMTALGVWLDKKFEVGYFTMILFAVGAIAGGQNIYRMAKGIYSISDTRRGSTKAAGTADVKSAQEASHSEEDDKEGAHDKL